jgi:hypothetical protein
MEIRSGIQKFYFEKKTCRENLEKNPYEPLKKFSITYLLLEKLQCHMSHYSKFFDPCMPLLLPSGRMTANGSLKCPFCPSYRWAPRISLLLSLAASLGLPCSPMTLSTTHPCHLGRPSLFVVAYIVTQSLCLLPSTDATVLQDNVLMSHLNL